jgi:hypothetical protein
MIFSALGIAGLLLAVGALVVIHHTTPRASSYRMAVIAVLTTAQIDVQHVDVIDGCAPTLQFCRTYAGVVHVQAGRAMTGQIACRERWTNCTLTLRDAGIIATPLPDVLDPLLWRWEQVQGQIMQWLRGMQ